MHLTAEQFAIVRDILAFYLPGMEVRAFGSRVSGRKVKDMSDLDLVVMTEREMPAADWARVKDAFELSPLPFRVDVLDWSIVPPEFRKVIERNYEVVQAAG